MSVVWPSASKSIQSRATAISGRLPTMKGTQYASRVSTSIPWLDSRRSTCLLAYLVFSPRASARPWPISATASEPDWIAPSVAPARERMRWACRQSSNRLFSTRWMPSNEICWLADKARPPLSEQEGSNPTFRILAIQSRRHQPSCARPFALMLFVSPKVLTRASLLIRPRIQMRGAMRMSCAFVAKVLFLDDDTIRTWYQLYQEDGIEGLASFSHAGGACRLTADQQEKLKAWVAETLPRTTCHVGAWIEAAFGIEYQTRSGLIALLHRLPGTPQAEGDLPQAGSGEAGHFHQRLRSPDEPASAAEAVIFAD